MSKVTLAAFGNSSSDYMKALYVAESKVGKTTYLAASCLGALPHQMEGLVDKPENLHILGFDEGFVDGLLRFIKESCKRGDEYLNVSVHDLTDVVRKTGAQGDWDYTLYNAVVAETEAIKRDVAKGGVHALVVSSLTGLANGLLAGLSGPPVSGKKGAGMDQAKWGAFGHQLSTLRNLLQADTHHTFWEGHITKTSGEDAKETMSVSGKTGQNFGYNTEQVFRLRREMSKYPNSAVDKVFADTRPSLDFMSGGRGFNESLDPREYDLVQVARKLGKKVGSFGGGAK